MKLPIKLSCSRSKSPPSSATATSEASSFNPPTYPLSRIYSHVKAKAPEPSKASPSRTAPHAKAKLSERQMHEIQHVFAQFDANEDGKISAEELRLMLALVGDEMTSEEAALMVREVDMDGDGYIDLGEFVDLNARCLHGVAGDEEMVAAFAIFDLDKNGRITAEELQEVFRRLGGGAGHHTTIDDCKRIIRGVDRKGIGHIDFDDFKRMMTPLTS